MSRRVNVPCWHATPVANAPLKQFIIGEGQARYKGHEIIFFYNLNKMHERNKVLIEILNLINPLLV